MTITIYNSLTRKNEEFRPLNGKQVLMYVCGITPYDEVHLGHARVYVAFDVISRHLKRSGFTVKFVQNFTDIDDKIIKRAKEKGISAAELSNRYIEDYFLQMDKLNIKRADVYPKVTENIEHIIGFIQKLIKNGYAYEMNGDVNYSVRKFGSYGKLSCRSIDDLRSGARVEIDEHKKDPLDFALWKKTLPSEPFEPCWDSPWGKGRPGWHTECSVMSLRYLGETLDIHGGGQDLIFPHHENEIAQSEAVTGKPFVRYWIHNGFVTVNHEKMSKSLGNFFTMREIFEKFAPRVVRYFLLSQHYKSPLDFSDDKLVQAGEALRGIDTALNALSQHGVQKYDNSGPVLEDAFNKFISHLDNDFSTEKAISIIHELKDQILSNAHISDKEWLAKAWNTVRIMLEDFLGIDIKQSIPERIMQLAQERKNARTIKDWKKADELRIKLKDEGFVVMDNPDGTTTVSHG